MPSVIGGMVLTRAASSYYLQSTSMVIGYPLFADPVFTFWISGLFPGHRPELFKVREKAFVIKVKIVRFAQDFHILCLTKFRQERF